MAENVYRVNLNTKVGVIDAFLFVAVLVLVLLLSRARSPTGGSSGRGARTPGARGPAAPSGGSRRLSTLGLLGLLVPARLVPVLSRPSRRRCWRGRRLLVVAMVAVSVSLLTGWGGQLSLGQLAFAGVGGMSTLAFRGLQITSGVGLPSTATYTFTVELPWLAALLAGTAVGVLSSPCSSAFPRCGSRGCSSR